MNRNSKIKRKLTASLAVGMSVMMSAVPVLAADQEAVYKDETVYEIGRASCRERV